MLCMYNSSLGCALMYEIERQLKFPAEMKKVFIEKVQRFEPRVGCSQRDSALWKCIYYYYVSTQACRCILQDLNQHATMVESVKR